MKDFLWIVGGTFVIVFAVIVLSWVCEQNCTPELEGVIHYPGASGGIKYVCRSGIWQPIREK